jgi:hypothetical protein
MIQLRTDDEASSVVAYGTACLLRLIVSAYLYPLQFILGKSGFFQQADAAQRVPSRRLQRKVSVSMKPISASDLERSLCRLSCKQKARFGEAFFVPFW